MRPKLLESMSVLLFLSCSCVCAQEPNLDPQGVTRTSESVSLVLPAGDPEAGKEAFQEHFCYSCHRVSDDPDFDSLPPLVDGPDLARSSAKEPGVLATAMVAPNHVITRDHPDYVDDEGQSMMPDFNQVLTVRELIDLLSYLRSSAEPVP